ncbi:helix-turn-helix transcriptional regulator, partial [Streptomyces scabiei]|uniref:tetratricopeptide repeat protein n=1 Tax=Streptomyces scabiei TaxID=1930 RepID=UPI0039EDE8A0
MCVHRAHQVNRRPASWRCALPPLLRYPTVDELEARAAALVARHPRHARLRRVGTSRAGSPLLLHALLDDLGGTPHPDGVPPVPDSCAALYPGSYPAAVAWWLRSAGPAPADVARCLAALEQAWPAGPPDGRGALRHALPHPRTPLPDGVYRQAPAFGTGYPQASQSDAVFRQAPPSDGVYQQASPLQSAYRQAPASDGVYRPAPPFDTAPRHPHDAPTARTRRPRDIAPGCRDVWSADPGGGGADPRATRPGVGAELPEHGPYPHPDEPADAAPYPAYPVHDPCGPYDGRLPSAPGAAYGRTDPPAHAPHRTTLWRTPSPPPARESAGDPVDVLAEAAGADPARIEGWLAAMTRLGLLRPDAGGRPRYAHPLLRDAVLSGWPRPRREAVHRAAAEAMLRRGDRVEAVARHLLRTPAVGRSWALRVLRDAVTVAVHDARPADAVGYLRRALDEPLTDDLRQRLLTELGSLEYASADAPAAIARLAEAQHLPADPRNRVRTAVALGTALAGRGEIRTAMEVLRRTEGRLSGHPGLARTVQTATALLSDEDLATRQEVYRWLSETGRHSPELVGTAGQALLVRYAATAALISADEAMARVRDLLAQPTDPLAEPFLLGTAAAVAQWADELEEAERLVERGLAGQHPALLHPMQHALLNTRADIVASRGDHARLLALAADPGPGPGPTNRDAHALMALVHTGRTDEALRHADRFDLREAPENWELNRYLYARGVLRAATGDPAGALHDFLECGRRQAAREVISPVVTPWRTAVAECRLALGGGPEALALATEELRLARVWNTPRTVGRALRVLGTATGGRRGLELAEEAVRTLRDAPADTDMELI